MRTLKSLPIHIIQFLVLIILSRFAFAQPPQEVFHQEDGVKKSVQNLYSLLASVTCPGWPYEPLLTIQNVEAPGQSSSKTYNFQIFVSWTALQNPEEPQCGPLDKYLGIQSVSPGQKVELTLTYPEEWATILNSGNPANKDKPVCSFPKPQVRLVALFPESPTPTRILEGPVCNIPDGGVGGGC